MTAMVLELNLASAILALIAKTKFDLMTATFTLRYCYSYQHSD